MKENEIKDRALGCIIGGACGDALGYPVEFVYSYKKIEKDFGNGGIKEYDLRYPWLNEGIKKALVSDDTQMTLYTLQGILDAEAEYGNLIEKVTHNYLAWYFLQTGQTVPVNLKSELTEIRELNQRRAPGTTCLSALNSIARERKPDNDSKGCGGVMRIAPIAVLGALKNWTPEATAKMAADISAITHLHPLSDYSSASLAAIIRDCLIFPPKNEKEFAATVERSLSVVETLYGPDAPELNSFVSYIRNVIAMAADPRPDWEVIEHSIGEGWVAEETLAIAIFSVMRHVNDFQNCLISAVNHGGDSDSTGAVAGNIIGSILGFDKIPESFIENLQLTDLIIRKTEELMQC